MKPVLSAWPAKRRLLAFPGFLLGIFFLTFLVLGFATNDVFFPFLLAVPAGVAGAWALVGWPVIPRKDGKPWVSARWKPWLFFPTAPLAAVLLYPILGTLLTKFGLPPSFIVPVAIPLAVLGAGALAYWAFGFPHLVRAARDGYARIPPERRPFLFFPIFAVIFLVLYILLGVLSTQAMGNFADKTVTLLNLQVLLLLPVALLLSALVAYLLVGFPPVRHSPKEVMDRVTGKHRPRAFLGTVVLMGIPLMILVGALLTGIDSIPGMSAAFLPGDLILPLSFLLGYSLALGLAAIVWGTPARWRRFDDYTPGLSPRARMGATGAASIATLLAIIVVFGLAGIDLFWGLLLGLALAILVALLLSGLYKRLAARAEADTLLPDLPERAKTLVLLTTWLVVFLLVFSILTYAFPNIVAWNAVLGLVLGIVGAFLLVEQGLLQDAMARRRAEKERRKAWEQRRKEALANARADDGDADRA